MKISIKGNGLDNFEPIDVEGPIDLAEKIVDRPYSLGVFDGDHRTNKSFISADLIGLDFDGGFTLDEAMEAFEGQWSIIGTTKSHQKVKNNAPPCDRFRVILKLAERVTTAEDHKATITALLKKYPHADKACSDAARYFEPCIEVRHQNSDGGLLPVVKYIKPTVSDKVVAPYMKGNLGTDTLRFMALGASEGRWNGSLYKAAMDLHEQHWTQEEAISALTGATRMYEGELDESDLKTIQSAYDKEPRYAPRGVDSMFNFKKASEMSTKTENIAWTVDGLLVEGGLGLLAGPSKAGKSTITRQLSQAVARGGEWLGRKVTKGTVLYLALEEQEEMLAHQLKKAGIEEGDSIFFHTGAPTYGDLKDNLTQAINKYSATLVVVDTMVLLSGFENLNDYGEVYEKLSILRNIARDTGAHILLIHHTNKMGGPLGSTAIQGAVDCFIMFSEVPGCPRYRKIDSKQRGGRQFNGQRLEYIQDEDF